MSETEIAIIGAGPAGLSAGIAAAESGAKVCLIDRNLEAGGQLFKQIHKFFGSSKHFAGERGFLIGRKLLESCNKLAVEIHLQSYVGGIFPEGKIMMVTPHGTEIIQAQKIILATGAIEKSLAFPGSTLPGVMGAGAAQTLCNIQGVQPGKEVLMVGSGNVGLIVTYQLLQAGVNVVGIVELASEIKGYGVHSAKIRRLGIPIYTQHTILEAKGNKKVEKAVIGKIDQNQKIILNSLKEFYVDTICLAIGLNPLAELAWMCGCHFDYKPALGSHIPWHNPYMETNIKNIYVAGDVAGIGEATIAMEEGKLAGLAAATSLGYYNHAFLEKQRSNIENDLKNLRR